MKMQKAILLIASLIVLTAGAQILAQRNALAPS